MVIMQFEEYSIESMSSWKDELTILSILANIVLILIMVKVSIKIYQRDPKYIPNLIFSISFIISIVSALVSILTLVYYYQNIEINITRFIYFLSLIRHCFYLTGMMTLFKGPKYIFTKKGQFFEFILFLCPFTLFFQPSPQEGLHFTTTPWNSTFLLHITLIYVFYFSVIIYLFSEIHKNLNSEMKFRFIRIYKGVCLVVLIEYIIILSDAGIVSPFLSIILIPLTTPIWILAMYWIYTGVMNKQKILSKKGVILKQSI
jgi:hypothetical protein